MKDASMSSSDRRTPSLLLLALLVFALSENVMADETLKVCAEANNLPFSNDKGEGFENKIVVV